MPAVAAAQFGRRRRCRFEGGSSARRVLALHTACGFDRVGEGRDDYGPHGVLMDCTLVQSGGSLTELLPPTDAEGGLIGFAA